MGKSNRSWNDKGAEKWLSNFIPKEQGNFRDDKAFEIEFLFLLVSCGETVIFPSLKKWCHDETFCLFKMHFFHHLVLFIQKGDCSSIKTTFPNPRNFWILLCMLFCRSILILVCLDTKKRLIRFFTYFKSSCLLTTFASTYSNYKSGKQFSLTGMFSTFWKTFLAHWNVFHFFAKQGLLTRMFAVWKFWMIKWKLQI